MYTRRAEDRLRHYYVDRYGWRGVLSICLVVVLSLADATFTLRLVTVGAAREINPLMDYFISLGPVVFLFAKYLLTGACMIVFLVLKNYRLYGSRVTVKDLIWFVLIGYAALIVYELVLISRLLFLNIDFCRRILYHSRINLRRYLK
jgi:hypothetical protein